MSFNIRERRLQNDYRLVKELDNNSVLIELVRTEGNPPDKYTIRYTCKGVEKIDGRNKPVYREVHDVSIYLHAEYPIKQPQIKWLTPIFHPNIHNTGAVCIGAWWPAKTLDQLILSMGEMLQYKNLDPKDPMNSLAASWARRNRHLFPIDGRELKGASHKIDIELGDSDPGDELGIKLL
ncbi:MAG: ubiquitin-conjugating enzyme E2 [Chloroflexota bacterium]